MRISDWSSDVCSSDLARFVLRYINGVLPAIDFDDEPGAARNEVANEGADRELAIEADACNLSGADLLPKLSFGVGCIQSEFARARGRSFVALVQQALPRPLPQAGRAMCAQSPNRFPSRLREGLGEGLDR